MKDEPLIKLIEQMPLILTALASVIGAVSATIGMLKSKDNSLAIKRNNEKTDIIIEEASKESKKVEENNIELTIKVDELHGKMNNEHRAILKELYLALERVAKITDTPEAHRQAEEAKVAYLAEGGSNSGD